MSKSKPQRSVPGPPPDGGRHDRPRGQTLQHKHANETWESYAERLIRSAVSRGDLAPGAHAGQPLADLGELDEEDWWLKRKLRREQVSCLPPTLAIRVDRARTLAQLPQLTSEDQVRATLSQLNERIQAANFAPTGPPSTTMPVDIEAAVAGWRQHRTTTSD